MPRTAPPSSLVVVVLAAGKGKRLKSKIPKVLIPVCGRPALWHVLQAASAARPSKIVIVVSAGADAIRDAVAGWGITPAPMFVDQGEPLGTAHAVLASERAVGRASEVLVMGGDDPLVEGSHVRRLLGVHRRSRAAASILTAEVDDPGGYGRVVRKGTKLIGIVEDSEASPEIAAIREMSTLVYAFRRPDLFRALPLIERENRQREHYLPDVLSILVDKGERVSAVLGDFGGWAGVNSRETIANAHRIMRERINARHLANGVSILDPSTTYIDVETRIGPDTVVRPLTFLEGATSIGAGCDIGPSVRIVESTIGDGSNVQFALVLGSTIGRNVSVGPFVRMRPGVVLGDGSKAGAFVDLKNVVVGRGSKVPHLAYVGDATIGEGANVGAGTITVNYDGYRKHRTVIGDDVRIGSDTMLIAPVDIGEGAVTGAGSVITKDVPPGALAVERAEQKVVPGYRKRKDAEAERTAKGKRTDKGAR